MDVDVTVSKKPSGGGKRPWEDDAIPSSQAEDEGRRTKFVGVLYTCAHDFAVLIYSFSFGWCRKGNKLLKLVAFVAMRVWEASLSPKSQLLLPFYKGLSPKCLVIVPVLLSWKLSQLIICIYREIHIRSPIRRTPHWNLLSRWTPIPGTGNTEWKRTRECEKAMIEGIQGRWADEGHRHQRLAYMRKI
jgi:hypothetical protein